MSARRPESGTPDQGAAGSLYLRLSLTDACNLRCRYCRPSPCAREEGRIPFPALEGNSEVRPAPLSDLELKDLVGRIHGATPIAKLRFTGGEPLLKANLPDLIAAYRAMLPRARLCLTTNGILLERNAKMLRERGVDFLNVSLDAADARTFEEIARGGGFEAVLRGIAAAAEAGFFSRKINTVLLRTRNGTQVPDLVRIAARFGFEIRFVELMPFGVGAAIHAREFLPGGEALQSLTERFPLLGEEPPGPNARRFRFRVDGRETIVGFIMPLSRPFCAACDRLRLDPRGRLYPCLRSERGIDLPARLRRGGEAAVRAALREALREKCAPPAARWPRRSMVQLGG